MTPIPDDSTRPLNPRQHRRRQIGQLGLAWSLAALAPPVQAQLFGRTAGLAPLMLGPDQAAPPGRAFELTGRTPLGGRVALASFTVDVVSQHLRQVPPSGVAIGIAEAATQFADLQLKGLDDAALQRATDSIYAAWLDAGRAAGLDMVTPQALLASPDWAAVRAAGQASGTDTEGRGIRARSFAPQGLRVNGIGQVPPDAGLAQPTGTATDAVARMRNQLRELTTLARAAKSGEPLELLARSLGAQLMSVRLVLAFTEIKDELKGHPHLLITQDGRTRVGLHLDARSSQIVISPIGNTGSRNDATASDDASTLSMRLPFMLSGPVLTRIDSGPPGAVDAPRAAVEAFIGWRGAIRIAPHDVHVDGTALAAQTAAALAALAPAVFKVLKSG